MTERSVFRAAIHPTDPTVDPGYFGLYVVTMLCLGAIPAAFMLLLVRLAIPPHPLDLLGFAAVIAAAGVAYGTSAGGVGLFRMGDKDRVDTKSTTTTTTTTETAAADVAVIAPLGTPDKPLHVAVKDDPK